MMAFALSLCSWSACVRSSSL